MDITTYLRDNSAAPKLLTAYTRRDPCHYVLKQALTEPLKQLMSQSTLNLEINPRKVLHLGVDMCLSVLMCADSCISASMCMGVGMFCSSVWCLTGVRRAATAGQERCCSIRFIIDYAALYF